MLQDSIISYNIILSTYAVVKLMILMLLEISETKWNSLTSLGVLVGGQEVQEASRPCSHLS